MKNAHIAYVCATAHKTHAAAQRTPVAARIHGRSETAPADEGSGVTARSRPTHSEYLAGKAGEVDALQLGRGLLEVAERRRVGERRDVLVQRTTRCNKMQQDATSCNKRCATRNMQHPTRRSQNRGTSTSQRAKRHDRPRHVARCTTRGSARCTLCGFSRCSRAAAGPPSCPADQSPPRSRAAQSS